AARLDADRQLPMFRVQLGLLVKDTVRFVTDLTPLCSLHPTPAPHIAAPADRYVPALYHFFAEAGYPQQVAFEAQFEVHVRVGEMSHVFQVTYSVPQAKYRTLQPSRSLGTF